MRKKLSYEFVKSKFEERGYKLLSKEYISAKDKLDFICPNGHVHNIAWAVFNRGSDCGKCYNTPVPFKKVKKAFEKEGYILLSTEYINNRVKLDYVCCKGHIHNVTWRDFQSDSRCPTCANNIPYTYEFVKEYFESKDYTLLSKFYTNCDTKLVYTCPEGHIHSVSFYLFKKGTRCPSCYTIRRTGEGHPNWKGGVSAKNLPLYKIYSSRLGQYHNVHLIKQDGLELLGVECTYCKKVFLPKYTDVYNRYMTILGNYTGESNLYCSEECKKACPTYGQILWPKDHKPYENSRPDQKQWATLVKERDNYICKKCGTTEGQMIVHHVDPVINNPIESMDIDNGITLCKDCHKRVHTLPNCSYSELRCV